MSSTVKYVTVLDAGSSGTRILVYKWDTAEGDGMTASLKIRKVFPPNRTEIESLPGLHLYDLWGTRSMAAYLDPLLSEASQFLLREGVESNRSVPIYLFATGGMRSEFDPAVPAQLRRRQDILNMAWLRMASFRRFDAGRPPSERNGILTNVRVISGQAEGLFAWVANNYGRAPIHPNRGVFEIGGSSAQIAFAPSPAGQEDHTSNICLFSQRDPYRVYSRSWDGLGIDQAQRTLQTNINNDEAVPDNGGRKDNPCIPRFHLNNVPGFTGTGEFDECGALADTVLQGQLVTLPAYPPNTDFVGISIPMHSYTFFSKLTPAGGNQRFSIADPYSRAAYTAAATTYCNGDANGFPNDPRPLKFQTRTCLDAVWTLKMLRDWFPQPNGPGVLTFPHKGDDDLQSRSSWTLGVAALLARHKGLRGCPGQPMLPIDPSFTNTSGFGDVDWPPIFLPSDSFEPSFSDVTTTPTEPANDVGIPHSNCLTMVTSSPTVSCIAAFSVILFAMMVFAYRRRRASAAIGKIALPTDMKDQVV